MCVCVCACVCVIGRRVQTIITPVILQVLLPPVLFTITMLAKHASALGNRHVILKCAISRHKWPRKVSPHKKRPIKVTTGEVFGKHSLHLVPGQNQVRHSREQSAAIVSSVKAS